MNVYALTQVKRTQLQLKLHVKTIGVRRNAKIARRRENVAKARWQKIAKKLVKNAKITREMHLIKIVINKYYFLL